MKLISNPTCAALAAAVSLWLAKPAIADTGDDDDNKHPDTMIVRSLERTDKEKKDVAWLGVAVEDVPEALDAQLGLKEGEGLVVKMVATNSPAMSADVHKYDVLVEFDGQMLVDPEQFRKLVRMHAQGDTIGLTLYRGGKKVSVSAKLSKMTLDSASLDEDEEPMEGLNLKLKKLSKLNQNIKVDFAPEMAKLELDQKKMAEEMEHATSEEHQADGEMKRAMEQAKRALERAMKEHPHSKVLVSEDKDMNDLASAGVEVDNDASVVVKKDLNSSKSILKTDDTGVYIIVADPTRRLTARDRDGKTLFDGEIETPDQQAKVPRAVWDKVKPMLDQLGSVIEDKPQSKVITVISNS